MAQDSNSISINDLIGQPIDSKTTGQTDFSNFNFPSGFTPEILSQLLNVASEPSNTIVSENVNRGSWTQEEDLALQNAINQVGENKWVEISRMIGTRSPKQARERWTNCLKPGLKREPFEQWEDDIIIQKHQELGNRWAQISRSLIGRSPGAVKNRWYTNLKNNLMNDEIMNSGANGMNSIPGISQLSSQINPLNSITADPMGLQAIDPTSIQSTFDSSLTKPDE